MSTFLGRFTGNDIAQQLHACIGCQECLRACPSITEPISVSDLNAQTLAAPLTYPVMRFARACTQCSACVSVCPVGLHRDAMMLWLKMRLLSLPMEDRATSRSKTLHWQQVLARLQALLPQRDF